MDATLAPPSTTQEPLTPDKVQNEQRLRKRRLAMSFASYLVTFAIVCFCGLQGLISVNVVLGYLAIALTINLGLLLTFQLDLNLRFRDPSLTALQMVVSLLPALFVMYFLQAGQARAVFLMITIVPALYGILALNTRQFLVVCLLFFVLDGILSALLYWQRPQVMDTNLELIQLFALILVLGEVAIIGGFINGLRTKLRARNQELHSTMAELSTALERIQELANQDALTGVFNRRHLFEVLQKETNRCQRASGHYSVCILDIDYFKQVNDGHGHLAGDEVLRGVARDIVGQLRNIDCFGRYGGEEFLLILPQTPLAGACIKAERVRAQVEALRFPSLGPDFRVTVSIGVAEHLDQEAPDTTINRADAALYRAKTQGRNQVVIDDSQCEASAP